jgi:hypothetical protein
MLGKHEKMLRKKTQCIYKIVLNSLWFDSCTHFGTSEGIVLLWICSSYPRCGKKQGIKKDNNIE